jgi:NADH-quinone oxidoreductase subunit N
MTPAIAAVSAGGLTQPVDFVALGPPLIASVGALLVLVIDLAVPGRARAIGAISAAVLVLAGLGLWPLRHGTHRTFCLQGQLRAPCSYVADDLSVVVQLVILGGALLVVLLSMSERLPPGEYYFLLLVSVAGALIVASARDLATLIVALEAVSLPSFALVAIRRDSQAAQAALSAFLTSVTATAVSLLGIAFVYAATGTLYLERIATGAGPVSSLRPLLYAGAVLVLAAPAFKLAAFPLHAWAPDTYMGAPLPIAGYLSVVSKAAGLVAVLVLVEGLTSASVAWAPALAVLAVGTMLVGNLGALRQRRVVRFLAWSSIAQAGYLLVPVVSAGLVADRSLAVAASVAYLAAYAAMGLGAFAVIHAAAPAGRAPYDLRLEDFRGLARTRPLLGLSLAFFLACLAGLPPGVVGLVVKVRVLELPVRTGLPVIAAVMAVATVIGVAYYLRFAVMLFADAPESEVWREDRTAVSPQPRVLAPSVVAAVLALVVTVVLSVMPALVVGVLQS